MNAQNDKPARAGSTTLKLIAIALLTLGLLIPLSMIDGVLSERRESRDKAVQDITATWGSGQVVSGPVLAVPYRRHFKVSKEVQIDGKTRTIEVDDSVVEKAYFLPSKLEIDGSAQPSRLHRGIYDAVVFSARLAVSGALPAPDWQTLKVAPQDVLWDDATVSFSIPDLRGAAGALELTLAGRKFPLVPGTLQPGYSSGLHAVVGRAAAAAGGAPFSASFDLNGSADLQFAPLGVENHVHLSSPWPDPKFKGAFLPAHRQVSARGFDAEWQVSYYGRSYPQASSDAAGGKPEADTVTPSLFGVGFLAPVDSYRNVDRAQKYGILFIALVFSAFFLYEVFSAARLHPLQYALVGLALCLFFLALLSLSEFLPFVAAYALAALAATALVSSYSSVVLGGGRRGALLGAGLGGVYAYLYIVLQAQDYSLLLGTALLSATLAAIMYATRRVDWYAVDLAAARGEER